jgi:hypothetical protein
MKKTSLVPHKPLLVLQAPRLAGYLALCAAVALVVQLFLGAPIVILTLALLAAGLGLLGFVVLGAYNLGAWVSLFYVLGNVLVALYAKTLLGQSLDSELLDPVKSFAVLASTSGALFAALWFIRYLPLGKPVFSPAVEPGFLIRFSWLSAIFGIAFWLLNRSLQEPGGDGFGGIAVFRDLLYMGIIARTAALLEKTEGRQSFDGGLGLLMGIGILCGLVDNTKTIVALSVLSYFATVLFYRGGIRGRTLVVLILGGAIFGAVVAPAIHGLRTLGQQQLTLSQRAEFIRTTVERLLHAPGEFVQLKQLAKRQLESGYYNYFGGDAKGQMILGRYASVQQIDPVIDSVNASQPWGGEAIWPAFARLVPRVINPRKPENTEAYKTLVHYGLVDPEGGKFPTLPLAGQAYAAYGWIGVLTIPFLTFIAFLAVIKKLGWQLYRNIYGIFFLCTFVIVYVSQGDFGQYMEATLRDFPLFALAFILIARVCHMRLGPARQRTLKSIAPFRHAWHDGGNRAVDRGAVGRSSTPNG